MILASADFVFPPTDGSVPPGLAVDFHLKYNPKHLFSVLYDVDNSSQRSITYGELAHSVYCAAHVLNPSGRFPQGTQIAFLMSTHTIQYIIMILGAMRAGLVPFPISPRTHISGIAHLLASTQTSLLVAGGSQSISDIIPQLVSTLDEIDFPIQLIGLPSLESIFPETDKPSSLSEHVSLPLLKPISNDTIVSILHSSGSTGTPRPVKYHLEGVFKNFIRQPFGWIYAGNEARVGTMALPTFHAFGMFLQVLMPLYSGYTQVLFAPHHTPVVPNSSLTLEAGVSTKCAYMMCVPAFLEAWSQDEDALVRLRKMKGIMFAGAPLADTIGNKLVDKGVRIHCCYGATEVGHVHEILDLDGPSDWGYVKFSSLVDARFIPQDDVEQTFELAFVASDLHRPFEINWELDGKPAYKTKDLVVPHPSNPELWKVFGRLDDQIVLHNGEKVNPGSMEAEIVKCPIARYAVMFGRERNQTGVLIELEESSYHLYHTTKGRIGAVDQIWQVQFGLSFIERANQTSPTHSRLEKQTVILVDPARPLPRTPKSTIPRSAALKLYAHDIEEMYLELERGSGAAGSVEPPHSWTSIEDVEAWVSRSVQNLLGREVDVAGDLFQQGMDSLTATMLLRTLKSALHGSLEPNVQSAATQINQQTIFGKPTVQQLTRLLVHLSKNGDESTDPIAEALWNMRAMIEKYDSGWPSQEIREVQPVQKERVIVTGTTGGLGSHLLAKLLESDQVEKIWAMNRKSSIGNWEREIASFEDKLLDVSLLRSEKLVLVDSDLEDPNLGLGEELYNEVRTEATTIIHNAWQVNFNLSLQSFEPSIRGVKNLLNLAFCSTSSIGLPRFVFTSSIAVAGSTGIGKHLKEVPVSLEDAATGMGYAQSKLVAEKILESAKHAGLQTCIVRIGQLTGDIKSGSWSTTDWVPSIIGSSVSVGCLPGASGVVSWLPLDVAAGSIIDICVTRNVELPLITHITHPRPISWIDMMRAFSASIGSCIGSELPIISLEEWNRRVVGASISFNGSESDRYKRFPSAKIQSMVDDMVQADNKLQQLEDTSEMESSGNPRLDITTAKALSETLRATPELGVEHVQKWVEYWESKGLFKIDRRIQVA